MQLVKRIGKVRLELKKLKNISIWDQFFRKVLDTIKPLPKTKHGNIYVMVAIDHYLKWCKTKAMMDHDVEIIVKVLESKVICKFEVSKYILIDNGIELFAELD